MAMSEEVHAICYDFTGLGEHKDLLRLALRLSIYVVRRWAARMSARGHRTVLLLDESWAVLEKGLTESASSSASAYLNEVARLGRKEGLSLLSLSQNFSDFAEAACGNAIIANSSTFLLGPQGNAGLGGYTKHLDLTARQQEQVQKLRRSSSWAEFLMIRDRESSVVRVVLDPFTRWVFTTAPDDRRRLRELEEKRKDLTLIERLRLLAKEAA
jgi:type IV secretory pathway VirB4 component